MDKDAESKTEENEESSRRLPDKGPQDTDVGNQSQSEALDFEEKFVDKASSAECENNRESETMGGDEESEYLQQNSVVSVRQSEQETETLNVTEPGTETLNVREPETMNLVELEPGTLIVTEPGTETLDVAAIENNIEVEITKHMEPEENDKRESRNETRNKKCGDVSK